MTSAPSGTPRFDRYILRTINLEGARTFYAGLLGEVFWRGTVEIVPLPDRARAAGAPAHWLGSIGVAEPDVMAARLCDAGAITLGPPRPLENGRLHPLKDPSGAVMAVGPSHASGEPAVWHAHLSLDPEASSQVYARTFGWHMGAGGITGTGDRYRPFGWTPEGESAGSFLDGARRPGIHTQWLFFFAVDDLDAAAARVRRLGGTALTEVDSGAGTLLPCDDPQGAAFGLWQRPRSS